MGSNNQENDICVFCGTNGGGRNLILSFDGTSNQFGKYNTNIIELYAQIKKDATQLTYYNSGIGTYARPSFASFTYWKQVVDNKIDLVIAWNFEKVLLAGYRWLSDKYQPGDRIYLFGFSRGAYQVRALAGMIKTVGLILPGNEEQIPFAYELYADLKSGLNDKGNDSTVYTRFKKAFSHEQVKVHFLGAWDTVSSVGIIRSKSLPWTNEFNREICYFRHALALDEHRVKFLPEYIRGGNSRVEPNNHPKHVRNRGKNGLDMGREYDKNDDADQVFSMDRAKEVWFAGCHSDIGGGIAENKELNNASMSAVWMRNEASAAGLRFKISEIAWNLDKLEGSKLNKSLTFWWGFCEILPFKRLSYTNEGHHTWWPHLARGRVIKEGQKIHASVAFIKGYKTKAILPRNSKDWKDITWNSIIEQGKPNNIDWAKPLHNVLELDLFDVTKSQTIIWQLKKDMGDTLLIGRLVYIASTYEGAKAIMVNGGCELIGEMLDADDKVKVAGAKLLHELSAYVIDAEQDSISDLLIRTLTSENSQVRIHGAKAMVKLVTLDEKMEHKLTQRRADRWLREMVSHGSADEQKAGKEAFRAFVNQCTDKTKLVVYKNVPNQELFLDIQNQIEHLDQSANSSLPSKHVS